MNHETGRPRTLRRWFKSTSRRTFVVYPVAIILFEFLLHNGNLRFNAWATPLLAWGYLQYRLAGIYRSRIGGGGPGLDNPPERLVDTGIYAFTRNPMYLGHLIFIIGLALTFRSWAAVALLLVHIPWFQNRVRRDEKNLQSVFGTDYDKYKSRVHRWIPGIPLRNNRDGRKHRNDSRTLMAIPELRTVTRTQGNNAALKSGLVVADGVTLKFEEVPVLVHAFRRMVRGLEFDVCEMALTTYLCAREHGVRFTALPIFLVRAFHHGAILHNIKAGISDPRQLEGKRVGVNRGYTVTTGVWARSVLQDDYGVDLGKITWVLSGDEHVEAFEPPENVVSLPPGETLEDMLLRGELAAAIGVKMDDADIQPLIPNALEAGLAAFKSRGHYPINHLIAVRDDVLAAHPQVAVAIFNAFTESKNLYLQRLREGEIENPDNMDKLYARMLDMGADPLPYGIEPNRQVLEDLIAHAVTQKILTKPVSVESVFASTTLQLSA